MNKLWTERTVDFSGKFDAVRNAGINPLPKQQPIPIWFGGQADAVLKRAATFGNGWIPLGNPGSNSAKALDKINGFLADAGRDPKHLSLIHI